MENSKLVKFTESSPTFSASEIFYEIYGETYTSTLRKDIIVSSVLRTIANSLDSYGSRSFLFAYNPDDKNMTFEAVLAGNVKVMLSVSIYSDRLIYDKCKKEYAEIKVNEVEALKLFDNVFKGLRPEYLSVVSSLVSNYKHHLDEAVVLNDCDGKDYPVVQILLPITDKYCIDISAMTFISEEASNVVTIN